MDWYALVGLLAILVLIIENHDILFQKMDDFRIPAAHVELWENCKEVAEKYDYDALVGLLKQS